VEQDLPEIKEEAELENEQTPLKEIPPTAEVAIEVSPVKGSPKVEENKEIP